jgi:hypothetical protein
MSASAYAGKDRRDRAKVRPMPALSKDLFVYAALFFLVWMARQVNRFDIFKRGDDVCYWLGVIGSVMMLLVFTYPLRKHFRFAVNWGPTKGWLIGHMILGVGGPLVILVHSKFEIGSLNAGVALYSMIIVALSGVLGRFLYIRVNRGLHGEISSLQDLKIRAGMEQESARSLLAFAPQVETLLSQFTQRELDAVPNWMTHMRRVFVLPLTQWWVYWRCVQLLRAPSARLAQKMKWDEAKVAERRRLAHKLVRRYLNAEATVAQFGAFEWMLSAWHIAHIPFVFLLVISTFVHIFAVHAY